MKRSIRAAAVLCAVAVAVSVLLAGCKNEDELGGHVGANPFKGLTITYDDEYDGTETLAFTEDTKGTYSDEYSSEDFEYAVDSTKGLLKLRITTSTTVSDSSAPADAESDTTGPTVETVTLDEYIEETYGSLGLDKETESLIYDALANAYWYYKFSADSKTVEMNSSYYFGSIAESDARFRYEDDADNECRFGRRMTFNIKRDDDWYWYEGYPKFSDNTFTAVIFEETYDSKTHTDTYTKLSTSLAGTYQISGTGTNCTGTVTFTQLPNELKGVFKVNKPYTIMQRDYGYKTYTVKN